MVVDDDPRDARGIKLMLRGHGVDIALDASAALERLAEGTYDLILCDVVMPEVDGLDLLQALTAKHPDAVERLVFLTGAASDPMHRDRLIDSGRPVYAKPTSKSALNRLIDEWVT